MQALIDLPPHAHHPATAILLIHTDELLPEAVVAPNKGDTSPLEKCALILVTPLNAVGTNAAAAEAAPMISNGGTNG